MRQSKDRGITCVKQLRIAAHVQCNAQLARCIGWCPQTDSNSRPPDYKNRSGSAPLTALTKSNWVAGASSGPGGGGHSDFGMRLRREALRRGTLLAGEVVVVSDGAAWIENTANTVFAGRKVIFVLDVFHVLEKLWSALQELIADDAERDAAWTRLKSLIRDGKAKEVADELAPHAERHVKVREFVNYTRRTYTG